MIFSTTVLECLPSRWHSAYVKSVQIGRQMFAQNTKKTWKKPRQCFEEQSKHWFWQTSRYINFSPKSPTFPNQFLATLQCKVHNYNAAFTERIFFASPSSYVHLETWRVHFMLPKGNSSPSKNCFPKQFEILFKMWEITFYDILRRNHWAIEIFLVFRNKAMNVSSCTAN